MLAQSTTFGYGPSGRFGFGIPGVRDRFHDFGHGGFFQEKFVRDFWLPWFRSGDFVKSKAPLPSGARWHLLTIIQIKWLALLLCVLSIFGIESSHVALWINNFSMPSQSPTPTPTATLSPTATPTPTTLYKLLWYNHFEPTVMYEVVRTNPEVSEIENNGFKSWCRLFYRDQYDIRSEVEVAGDEHFKSGEPNWWTRPPYNLPPLRERWFQIMDDERWYVVTLRNK